MRYCQYHYHEATRIADVRTPSTEAFCDDVAWYAAPGQPA